MSPRGHKGTSYAMFQPLTRQEIDRRIQDVVSDVSVVTESLPGPAARTEGFRFIAPADLVRRMRPYLVFN